jgi:hypothetical protein
MNPTTRFPDVLTPPEFALSAGQLREFNANGFMSVARLVEPDVLEKLRRYYDRFVLGEIKCGEDNDKLGGKIHQIMYPSKHEPYFVDNPVLAAGKRLGKQILGREVGFIFDMLIDKPPQTLNETPWHQDYAYTQQPFAPAGTEMTGQSLQFWVALDDVDIDNGCMQFIPGMHRQPLTEHYVASGDPMAFRRLLSMRHVDASLAVACPLDAGGCTIHHYGTPHYTGGNHTPDKSRRAYIFNIG